MAKTATDTNTPSKKKTHAPAQTHEKKSQQEKKASASHKADEKKARASAQNDEKQKHKEQAKQEAKLMLKAEQAKRDVQKAEQKLAKAQARLEEARTQQQTLEQKLEELRTPQQEEVTHNGIPAISDEPLTTLAQADDASVMDDTSLSLTTPFIEQSADTADTTEVPEALVTEAQDVTATSVFAEVQDTTTTTEPTADGMIVTDLQTEQPPAEGRTDIPDASQEQSTPTSIETSPEETQSAQTPATDATDVQISSDTASMPLFSHDANTWPPPLIREEVAEAAKEVEESDAATAQETSAHEEEANTSNATNGT